MSVLLLKPSGDGGEVCFLVRPSACLRITPSVILMFLRALCVKWLPPMENASPSPLNAKTCRSGRESETPLANGSARPCRKCAPCACTKYGKRLEQPMPEMVVIFSCHSLRFSISLKYRARTEKSPQPGHHVGWSATISLRVRPGRSPVAGFGALMVTTGFSVKVWLILFGG